MVIDDNFKLSLYRKNIIDKFKDEYGVNITKSKVSKLDSTLTNKKNYVIHAKLWKYYVKLVLKVKITKILTVEKTMDERIYWI